jgi:hypothetical protein
MSSVSEPSRTRHTIQGISKILNEIIEENESNLRNANCGQSKHDPKFVFSCRTPPTITLDAYFDRILKYSKIEESTLIISLIYLDRVCDLHNLDLSSFNIHRY